MIEDKHCPMRLSYHRKQPYNIFWRIDRINLQF